MVETAGIIENLRSARREEALEVAKKLLKTMGEKAKAELMGHLAAVDLDFALGRDRGKRHLSLVVGDTINDLEALGIKLPETPRLITEAGNQDNLAAQIDPEDLSQKELELWMARYFKDAEARSKTIELFWGSNPAFSREKKDFIEVAHKISDVLNVPKQETGGQTLISMGAGSMYLTQKAPATNNLYHAGATTSEVQQKKVAFGRDKEASEVGAEIIPLEQWIKPAGNESTSSNNKEAVGCPDEGLEFYERYRDWKLDQIEAYIESEFSFCVFTMFQEVETLVWFSEACNEPLPIPSAVRQKLDLISSLAEVNGLHDYSEHFEPAVKAFIQYYLPRFKPEVSSGVFTPISGHSRVTTFQKLDRPQPV